MQKEKNVLNKKKGEFDKCKKKEIFEFLLKKKNRATAKCTRKKKY